MRFRFVRTVVAVAVLAATLVVAPAVSGASQAAAANGCVKLSLKIDPLVAHPGDRVGITTGVLNCGNQVLRLKGQMKVTQPALCGVSTSNWRAMVKPNQLHHAKLQFKPKCKGKHFVNSRVLDEDTLDLLGEIDGAFDVV